MKKRLIEVDHEMHQIRLCWRKRSGGKWNSGLYCRMTKGYANKLVNYFNDAFPEDEHWAEFEK